jgi:hypothetical protein
LSVAPGTLLHRLARCLTRRLLWVMWPTEHLLHLPIKTSPSGQGARPHGATRHAGRRRVKRKAARWCNSRKKMLVHSRHHHIKNARRLQRWRASAKTRLHLHDGLP